MSHTPPPPAHAPKRTLTPPHPFPPHPARHLRPRSLYCSLLPLPLLSSLPHPTPSRTSPHRPSVFPQARQVLLGEWSTSAGTAAGSPNHGAFHKNPQACLSVAQPAEVTLRLRCPNRVAQRPSGLSLSIFGQPQPLTADWHTSKKLATSNDGNYAYPVGGVAIPRVRLAAGSYICVISTFDPTNAPFELIAHAPEGTLRLRLL